MSVAKKSTENNITLKNNTHSIFQQRWEEHQATITQLFNELYQTHSNHNYAFDKLFIALQNNFNQRSEALKKIDATKKIDWFLSNEICGMSLYVDRFCSNLSTLKNKVSYFEKLGINFLHLMPLFESPKNKSDGGYAVSNYRKLDERFGNMDDLLALNKSLQGKKMYLMLDIVLNHTSDEHEWALKAKQGDTHYQDYYYFFDDRRIPDLFEQNMPEVFPESSPGNFTYVPECNKWAMSVFHSYQWDLNFSNPYLLVEMVDTVLFYANLGVDILRIDAPAFIWKQLGTSCQNLPQAHTILQLLKKCVQVVAPGMALLGEAIVAPKEIMKYFGTNNFVAQECDVAYNATHMALQWDALATGNTKVLLNAQADILQKPSGTTWINYTRCHDDIGLAYDDWMIEQAGFNPYQHRKFLKDFYTGNFNASFATGALFSSNPKTGDARISGSLASLCGLEKAVQQNNETEIETSIKKILFMQAHSFFLGGIPMLFYGDETGSFNDYSYLQHPDKSYDNRWMHRPIIDWNKNDEINFKNDASKKVFEGTQKLLQLRKHLTILCDTEKIYWLNNYNDHICGYVHTKKTEKLICLFNFSNEDAWLTWFAFKETGCAFNQTLVNSWNNKQITIGRDDEYFVLKPYEFAFFSTV
jgi:amylosucrase